MRAMSHPRRVSTGRAAWLRCALAPAAAAVAAAVLAGCASRAADVAPLPTDPAAYRGWSCDRLFDERDLVQLHAADVAYAVDARAGNNMIALGVGVTVFWPAVLAMRPDGLEAQQLAELKGRYEALRSAAAEAGCGEPSAAMPPARQASLPVALGDRLVYDERSGANGSVRTLVMQVAALRRDQIEFSVDSGDPARPALWRQDLAGNPALDARAGLIGWRRLLKPDLSLGQVLSGELAAADEQVPGARVRGQVVATGPQTIAGRHFDVAVIELFGDAPAPRTGAGESLPGSVRLDGVMAVDRRSGLLLRLELRCANADYALRRRLLRVEPASS